MSESIQNLSEQKQPKWSCVSNKGSVNEMLLPFVIIDENNNTIALVAEVQKETLDESYKSTKLNAEAICKGMDYKIAFAKLQSIMHEILGDLTFTVEMSDDLFTRAQEAAKSI